MQVCFSEIVNLAFQKECNKGDNKNDQKIYVYMAHMSDNEEIPSINFGDSSKLTNWVLDSGLTCHMTPDVLHFTPGSLEDMDKHIEVADRHHFRTKQKVQVKIKMCNNNRDTFIETLCNLLLAPDICNRLFPNILLIN